DRVGETNPLLEIELHRLPQWKDSAHVASLRVAIGDAAPALITCLCERRHGSPDQRPQKTDGALRHGGRVPDDLILPDTLPFRHMSPWPLRNAIYSHLALTP